MSYSEVAYLRDKASGTEGAAARCQMILAKAAKDRFLLKSIKDGRIVKERVWKSRNTVLDELKKSGMTEHRVPWPKQFGDKVIFNLKYPTNWYWRE